MVILVGGYPAAAAPLGQEQTEQAQGQPSPRQPHFRHKQSSDNRPIELCNNRHRKHSRLGSQLATTYATSQTARTSVARGTAAAGASGAAAALSEEVSKCRKLCDLGLVSAAVDALDPLVHRGGGHRVLPRDVFYRLLKGCIQDKDLALGSRVHALILVSGYRTDAFLATQLISLYASHGRLDQASRVFADVSNPNVYNWAAIILAYARQGQRAQAAHAIQLYRRMCTSTSVVPDDRLYSAVLKACAAAKDLVAGRGVHAHIMARASPPEPDRFVQAALVNMYAKCGSLEEARTVFDRLLDRDVVTWTTMIAGYAQEGKGREALDLYRRMQQEGLTPPDCVTYACLLQACASVGVGAIDDGKQLHAQIRKRRLQDDVVVSGSLVNMYVKCGSLSVARTLFDKLHKKNIVAWNAMLAGYAQQGMGEQALCLYESLRKEGGGGLLEVNSVTFVCMLQACAGVGPGALDEGKQLHAQIRQCGLEEDAVLGGSLVRMYARCGSLEGARLVFDKLSSRDVVTWTAMIAGYSQQGMGREALSLYENMKREGLAVPDCVTYVCLLQACASVGLGALDHGKQLHAEIEERGLLEEQQSSVLSCSLVNMYAKCCSIQDARTLFDKLPDKNVVTWTAMIAGYAQHGMAQDALALYRDMQHHGSSAAPPNSVTYTCLLQACASVGMDALHEGRKLHADITNRGLQENVVVSGSLVNMYAKCGSLDDAHNLFAKLSEKNIVAWNAMIAGYAQQGMGQDALTLYASMRDQGIVADSVTYVSLLQACAIVGVGALEQGRQLHTRIGQQQGLQQDGIVGRSLANMYVKCGSLQEARVVFDRLSNKDAVTWTVMIAGYAQQGMGEEALVLYKTMRQDGGFTLPDCITYVCLLQACAQVVALPLGEQLHAEIEERGMQADAVVAAALVNMYAKCGSMYDSQRVFDTLSERNVEVWGALVSGYARQGDSQVVFDLVDRMRLQGIQPDEVTFVSVLTVCSHVGLVNKGREYFELMTADHGIVATMEHYICMVDLLGRAGHLDEALQMAHTMPFPPNDVVWHTLLGACRKWKCVRIGQQAFQGAVALDEKDAAAYVLMSNIYASMQMWEAAKEMQAKRKELEAWKKPGQSWWTDMGGVVHTFLSGDKKHPESQSIYARLGKLISRIKKRGYVPHLESSILVLPDDDKEAELCAHSEKLAIALALNKTAYGSTIRIAKNLRVCEDCHRATAYMSRVEERTIICRDSSRFHVFKDGKCSCGDFW